MPRKKSLDIPEEELTQLDNNEIGAKELSEKYNKPRGYFDNLKHTRKLKTSFTLKESDQALENNDNQPKPNTSDLAKSEIQMIDYRYAVKGFYKGMDSVLKLGSVLSRGVMEYETLPEEKIQALTDITFNDPMVQKVSTLGGVSTIVTIGAILGTFAPQIKIKKSIKHDSKSDSCKCKKCEKERKMFEEYDKDLKDVKEVVQVKEITKDDDNKQLDKLAFKIEDVLKEKPITTSSGLIIEKNIPKNITEDQVIKQNAGVNNG